MAKGGGKLYGLVAEFDTAEQLLGAARRATEAGYLRVEGYSPFPVDGLADALGFQKTTIPQMTFVAGLVGGLCGFGMCWYANVVSYPLDIGGRPHNSWPAWIPITFEMTVLFAALTAAIGMLCLNGLPRLNHPIFNAPHFELASHDRFFLCIEAKDPRFGDESARAFLATCQPLSVAEVWE